jgi:hypothetical protein
MATVLTEFPERFVCGKRRGVSKWDKYLDGQVWRLESGVDFTTNPRGVQTALSVIAKRRGFKVLTMTDGSAVVIQRVVEAK